MRQIFTITACVVATVFLATACSKKDMIAQKDQEIAELNADVQQFEQQIDELESEVETQRKMNRELESTLSEMREEKDVLLRQREGLTHISLDGAATFPTASAELTEDAKRVINRVGKVLQDYPDRWVVIEGHADERAINESFKWKYASNWELSTARANAVLHYLLDEFDVDPARVKAVGLGAFHPLDESSTPDAWAKNRRVVITVGSKLNIERHMASRNDQ